MKGSTFMRQLGSVLLIASLGFACRNQPTGGNPPPRDSGAAESVRGWVSIVGDGAWLTMTVHLESAGLQAYSATLKLDDSLFESVELAAGVDGYRVAELNGGDIELTGFSPGGFETTEIASVRAMIGSRPITAGDVELVVRSARDLNGSLVPTEVFETETLISLKTY